MRGRTLAVAAVAIVALAAAGMAGLFLRGNPAATGLVAAVGVPDIGGPFAMVDDQGRPVTEADLKGKPTAIFFGFTHCPEVCPTTLGELSVMMAELGPAADRLNVVFVSVDPQRDTPDVLHEYVSAFDPRFRGFTGTEDQVKQITDAYKVYYKRVPTENGYTMDHTATVYLMDAATQFFGTISYDEDQASALEKLKRLTDSATA